MTKMPLAGWAGGIFASLIFKKICSCLIFNLIFCKCVKMRQNHDIVLLSKRSVLFKGN